ncbi:baseplate J/gp47 family protein [Pseudochelatococcus lubricantis]|uniref:baseplate J/gp47 family protein n=1 Tax=Pseudochelatococcus lubricantis TaxID=1538102 RepID=UPI0035EDD96C
MLTYPPLDDRRYDDLLREALALIDERCPQWTDRNASDPGITLVELFAHLTDIMLYRLNRLPEKVHYALLDLLGVAPRAPAPATVTLTFRLSPQAVDAGRLVIPRGTAVSDKSGSVTFHTLSEAAFPQRHAPDTEVTVEVRALHAERVEAEVLGTGTGAFGQAHTVRRGPILRRPVAGDDLRVAVELGPDDSAQGREKSDLEKVRIDGRTFALWREVESFAGLAPDAQVFAADRLRGTIIFMPSAAAAGALADQTRPSRAGPAKDRQIRAWYLRGGGVRGNVLPGTLTVMKTPVPQVNVENREPAFGGEDKEPVAEAIARGSEAVRVLRSAVTTRDFENVAREVPGIARARAYAQRDLWAYGRPGVVHVLIVPKLDAADTDADTLASRQSPGLLADVETLIRRRRPVGVETHVEWARCRKLDLSAHLVVSEFENAAAVRARLTTALRALLAPDGQWAFGQPLRASDIYETLTREPGVRYAERLQFHTGDAPSEMIVDIHRDRCQETTCFAAGRALFRSLDRGESWETVLDPAAGEAARETFLGVRTAPFLPGKVAAFSRREEAGRATYILYISEDGGESWRDTRREAQGTQAPLLHFVFPNEIRDVAWSELDGMPVLFIAGRDMLQRIRFSTVTAAEPVPVRGATEAERREDQRGFEALATARHLSGLHLIAVAAREGLGIFIAVGGGTFRRLPNTTGRPVSSLAFQQVGNETFLWAGFAAAGGEPGQGAMRIGIRLDGSEDPTGWQALSDGWTHGSCEAFDFWDDIAIAGSNRGGILCCRPGRDARWSDPPAISCGLPPVDERRSLPPVRGAAIGPSETDVPFLFFGGEAGIYRSADLGRTYAEIGSDVFDDKVPLPRHWLFRPGAIELTITSESGESL